MRSMNDRDVLLLKIMATYLVSKDAEFHLEPKNINFP